MAISFTRRLLVVAVTGLAVLGVTVPVSSAAPSAAGYCPNGNGVTVIVDFQEVGGGTEVRCASGQQATGVAALQNAGFTIQGTERWGLSFICRIQGKPGAAAEPCVDTPPASAYWGYWHAQNGGSWTYSQQGAANRKPPPGSFEGWSFSKNKTTTTNPPPGIRPVRPAAATTKPVESAAPETLPQRSRRLAGEAPQQAKAPAKNPYASKGVAAGRWLANEVRGGKLDGPGGPGFTDWGLTIDALLMLRGTGADAAKANSIVRALQTDGKRYYQFPAGQGKTATIAGAAAKTLVAAVAAGKNPADFGGANLRKIVTGLINTNRQSPDYGRISDKNTGTDNSNTFGQSFGVLGLADSGKAPQSMVDFLIKQQCPSGGFRLSGAFGGNTPTCSAAKDVLDPDSTGMAVQALLAAADDGAKNAKAAAGRGVAWLLDTQKPNGSFGGSGPTAESNTNSTGLAAQALAAAGETAAANKAAKWIGTHQLTKANGDKANADAGAIAYNRMAFATAVRDKEATKNRIAATARDQWRRATAQAGLAFTTVRLGRSGTDAGPNPGGGPSTEPPGPDDGVTGGPGFGADGVDGASGPAGDGTGTGGAAPAPQPSAVPQAATLANTGFDLWQPLLIGLGMLVAGAAALFGGRRVRLHGSSR